MHVLFVGSPDPVPVRSAPSLLRRPVLPFPVPSHMPCSPGCQHPTSAGHKRWTRWTSPWWGRRLPRNGLPRVYLPDRRQEVGPQIDRCLSQRHHVDAKLTSLPAISVVSKTLFGWFVRLRSEVFQMGPVNSRLFNLLVCLWLCSFAWLLLSPPTFRSSSTFSAGISIRAPTTGGSELNFYFSFWPDLEYYVGKGFWSCFIIISYLFIISSFFFISLCSQFP